MKQYHQLFSFAMAALTIMAAGLQKATAQSWNITGNTGTNVNTNFIGTKDNAGFVFRTNNTERMRLTATGNVGIGLANPIAPLQVIGTNTTTLKKPGYMVIGPVSNYNLSLDDNDIQARIDSAESTLNLNYWGGDVWIGKNSNAPVIYGNASFGTVGIGGYAAGDYMLNLNTRPYAGGLRIRNTSSLYCIDADKSGPGLAALIGLSDTGSNAAAMQVYTNGHGPALYATAFGNSSTGVVANGGYGGYGIVASGGTGTTGNPGYAGYFNGYIYATGITFSSDQKLKKNIAGLSNATSIINKLKPKTYEFIRDGNYEPMHLPDGLQYGLIAQDVEEVLPELVKQSSFHSNWADASKPGGAAKQGKTTNSETIAFKTVNYIELIPILIRGMQEQQQVIEQLQQQIAGLQQPSATLQGKAGITAAGAGYLAQNTPNPFGNTTAITYNLPKQYASAKIVLADKNGRVVKEVSLKGSGNGQITLDASLLASGSYLYALYVDGKLLGSKQMIVIK